MTSRKVAHYFDEHLFTIVSSAPLADILKQPVSNWSSCGVDIELSLRDLQLKHPTSTKSQVLPNFLVEWREVQTPAPQTSPTSRQCSSMGQKDRMKPE